MLGSRGFPADEVEAVLGAREPDALEDVGELRARLDALLEDVILEKQSEMAAEFDAVHSVDRALEVGSLETLLAPEQLRPAVIDWLRED